MSNISKLAALLLTCSFALNLRAQSLSATDQQGIDATFKSISAAFEKMDAPALSPFFTENAVSVSPMGQITRGHDNLIAMYTGLFNYFKSLPVPDRYEEQRLDWQARYLTQEVVAISFVEMSTSYFGDKNKVEKMAYSLILRKKDSKWLVEQVSLTPVIDMQGSGK